MARPERHDVDYFPFYVKDGRTLFILEDKYGCKGTGFFTNVMRFLCLQPDHHFCIKEEVDRMYFFSKTKCDEVSGMEMLDIMAKTCKLSGSMWVSYKVIVSPALLDSIKDAYRNRKNEILSLNEIEQIYVSYNNNPQESVVSDVGNTQESVVSDVGNTQTKLKKTKLKKTKYRDYVFLYENEYQKLVEKHGKENTEKMLDALDYYKGSKGKTYKDDYRAILSWVVDKVVKEKETGEETWEQIIERRKREGKQT